MPSRSWNTGWLLTHLLRRTIVYRERNRSCWCGGARNKRKLQACNYLALASIFQITPIFKTNFSSRACIHFKWKSCIPLAWYVSIVDADGLGIHRQGITSHKADPQLATYLPAISIRISSYSSVSETRILIITHNLLNRLTHWSLDQIAFHTQTQTTWHIRIKPHVR